MQAFTVYALPLRCAAYAQQRQQQQQQQQQRQLVWSTTLQLVRAACTMFQMPAAGRVHTSSVPTLRNIKPYLGARHSMQRQ
jgi:hypothetical protein